MKRFYMFLSELIVGFGLMGWAYSLIVNDKEGWGWFIFFAFLLFFCGTVRFSNSENNDE